MAEARGQEQCEDTFPKLLLRNAKIFGANTAIREKDLGIWQSWTWAQVLEEIRPYSIGLKTLGVKRGDTVAVIGTNRPRLYWTFAAVQALGAVPVPVYADSVAEELAYVLEHAGVGLAVCEDQEQVDKVLSKSDDLPALKRIVYDEPRGLRDYDHTHLHSFEWVQEEGRKAMAADPGLEARWLEEIDKGKGEDIAVILYTSGTTGRPKGVMLNYDNLVISARNGNAFENLTEDELVIAYLPLAWVGDHVFSYAQSLEAGFCVCCPESMETIEFDRREIAPTYFFAPPAIFEGLLTAIMVRMDDAGWLKRRMFDYFLAVAERVGEKILNAEPVSFLDRIRYMLGNFFVYGPLRNRMGMLNAKVVYTAGEAIGPKIFSFFRSLGINLKQLYGQTEASVYVTIQPNGEIFPDTVGRPAPDVEIKITDDGEVLYRSPGVFVAYYKNDEATKETKTEDGWVHTGDAGFITREGHLKIIDRAKDVGRLNDGSRFAPKYVENLLKFFPDVQEVVAFGHERDYCTVFVNINLTSVGNWAERNNIVYASYQELAGHPKVYDMIERHIRQVNRELAAEPEMAGSQIRRFLVLHKELDADDGELTRTLKVRRRIINERYAELIEALYDGSTEKHVATEVTFEDGRKGVLEATLTIRDIAPEIEPELREAAE